MTTPSTRPSDGQLEERVQWVLEWLKDHSTNATLDGMARFAIPADKAFGVAVRDIKRLGAILGRDQDLAAALWDTGQYEARMLTSFVADPARISSEQMDRWCRDFDNWAYCDTLSFNLFDRTPYAWAKVEQWSREDGEFQRRTAFALLWSLALHDKAASDGQFVEGLRLIEQAAGDDRNFVKKAVSMALRAIGKRSPALNASAVAVAARLAASTSDARRWVGRAALSELNRYAAKERPKGDRNASG